MNICCWKNCWQIAEPPLEHGWKCASHPQPSISSLIPLSVSTLHQLNRLITYRWLIVHMVHGGVWGIKSHSFPNKAEHDWISSVTATKSLSIFRARIYNSRHGTFYSCGWVWVWVWARASKGGYYSSLCYINRSYHHWNAIKCGLIKDTCYTCWWTWHQSLQLKDWLAT